VIRPEWRAAAAGEDQAGRWSPLPDGSLPPTGTVLAVVHAPAAVLSTRADEVEPGDADLTRLAERMVQTMYGSPGCVGLAAPQVGRPVRLFCLDVTGQRKARSCHGLLVLANPVLVSADDPQHGREGCLSVPDLTGDVPRARRVVVHGVEPGSGRPREIEADAFEARAVQHEIDHLDGLLFLDRVAGAHALFARRRYL
jgi:peptide deformylase